MAGYIGSKASIVSSGAERKKVFDITATTTSLTGCSYTPNQVHVFHNGVRLVDGTDYTATDGSTVTLTTAAQSGDEVVVVSYATFQTSDTVSASAGGTFSNAVTIDANGATVLTVDRATSNGTIIDLQKNGSSVGSIGTQNGSDFFIGSSPATIGLRFQTNEIVPVDASAANKDASIDLGKSIIRFKNLYLSGGVYLGGTGAANYLDDYEEGTFNVSVTFGGVTPSGLSVVSGACSYTKVGRLVTCTMGINASWSSSSSGDLRITGLPFTEGRGGGYVEPGLAIGNKGLGNFTHAAVVANSTQLVCYKNDSASSYTNGDFNGGGASGFWFHGSLVYFTS